MRNSYNGLYLVKQRSTAKGVDHYGILDVGNRAKNLHVLGGTPVVIHLMPSGLQVDYFNPNDNWAIIGKVIDEAAAISRLQDALTRPTYNPFSNNCEHFARYVATAINESSQVQGAAILVGILAAMPLIASTFEDSGARRHRR